MAYPQSRCCSYTVRAYDADGVTLWLADYFRDAISGEYDLVVSLSVTVIGDRVFVGGPRVAHVFGGGTTYWNLCVYDLGSGSLVDKYDLWDGAAHDGTYGPGDIQDLCAGDDGSLGVLFWQQTATLGRPQLVASYDPSTLSENWTSRPVIQGRVSAWLRLQIDSAGTAHMGGGTARRALVLDGTDEYICGSGMELTRWWAGSAFAAKVPGPNGIDGSAANIVFGNKYDLASAWAAHITEENAVAPTSSRTQTWWTICNRWAVASGIYYNPDATAAATDIGVMRDSGGSPASVLLGGVGLIRGDSGTAGLPSDLIGAVDPARYAVAGTTGAIADQGCVGVFDLSGTFVKAYSPTGVSGIGRIATVPGDGYYLSANGTGDSATLMARDATDAHVWAHHHHRPSDIADTPPGGVITVGERARRGVAESDFIAA